MPLYSDPWDYFFGQQELRQPAAVRAEMKAPFHSQEEEDSALRRLLGVGASGLAYVGGVLDKTFGGRAVRGLLGGNPRELLSVLPGSDTLGITKEEQRVSGEDLAKQ
jgi:hypothetical protein